MLIKGGQDLDDIREEDIPQEIQEEINFDLEPIVNIDKKRSQSAIRSKQSLAKLKVPTKENP